MYMLEEGEYYHSGYKEERECVAIAAREEQELLREVTCREGMEAYGVLLGLGIDTVVVGVDGLVYTDR